MPNQRFAALATLLALGVGGLALIYAGPLFSAVEHSVDKVQLPASITAVPHEDPRVAPGSGESDPERTERTAPEESSATTPGGRGAHVFDLHGSICSGWGVLDEVFVLAWPTAAQPDLEAVRKRSMEFIAQPMPGGNFTLAGLPAGHQYTVCVAGPGLLADAVSGIDSDTPQPIELELRGVLGAIIEFVDASGVPLGQHDLNSVTCSAELSKTAELMNSRLDRALAGIPDELSADWRRFLLLYKQPFDHLVSRPVVKTLVSTRVFGFRPSTAEIWLAHLDGAINVERVFLEATASGFGSLGLEYVSGLDRPGVVGLESELVFTGADGAIGRRSFTTWPPPESVRGLPAGLHEVTLSLHEGHVTLTQSVTIRTQSESRVSFELPHLGGIRITTPSFAPRLISVSSFQKPELFYVHGANQDTPIMGLTPGKYRLKLPPGSDHRSRFQEQVDVTVEEDRISEVAWPRS